MDYAPLALACTHVIAGVLVLTAAKFLAQFLSPYSVDEELTSRDNPAFGLALAGYYAGAVIIYLGAATIGPLPLEAGTAGVARALAIDIGWALGGIVAMNGSRWAMDRTLVIGTQCANEVKNNRNVAAGVLEFGAYVATALVLAGAIHQPGGTIWSVLALFLLGQCALILIARVYQRLAGYDVGNEICGANLAAGVAFSLSLVAVALIMMNATSAEFTDWNRTLTFFALDAIFGVVFLLALRWVVDLVLLPNARIAEEIVRDRNVNVGLVEGVLAVCVAAVILYLF